MKEREIEQQISWLLPIPENPIFCWVTNVPLLTKRKRNASFGP